MLQPFIKKINEVVLGKLTEYLVKKNQHSES